MHYVVMIVTGLIVGILARFLYPGAVHMGLIASALLGRRRVPGRTSWSGASSRNERSAVPPRRFYLCDHRRDGSESSWVGWWGSSVKLAACLKGLK